jgi:hypothetical protein
VTGKSEHGRPKTLSPMGYYRRQARKLLIQSLPSRELGSSKSPKALRSSSNGTEDEQALRFQPSMVIQAHGALTPQGIASASSRRLESIAHEARSRQAGSFAYDGP